MDLLRAAVLITHYQIGLARYGSGNVPQSWDKYVFPPNCPIIPTVTQKNEQLLLWSLRTKF